MTLSPSSYGHISPQLPLLSLQTGGVFPIRGVIWVLRNLVLLFCSFNYDPFLSPYFVPVVPEASRSYIYLCPTPTA